jgi:hypothetical protein
MTPAEIPEGWEVGHLEGHYTKIMKIGNCTATVHRPFLDEKERAKREERVRDALRGLIKKGVFDYEQ